MHKTIFLFAALLINGCGNNVEIQRVNKGSLLELMHLNPKNNLCYWHYDILRSERRIDGYINLDYTCSPSANYQGSTLFYKYRLEILKEEYEGINATVMYKGKKMSIPKIQHPFPFIDI